VADLVDDEPAKREKVAAALRDPAQRQNRDHFDLIGVRKFVTDVTELNVDLIDSVNPFSEAYSILSKTMDGDRLREVEAVIAARKVKLDPDEARMLAKRARTFKNQHSRLPSITSPDAWERRMAEGVAYLQRMQREAMNG
jgi:hypothetical protein